MSGTAITLKFEMSLFLDEACSWAEKLFTDINLLPLMPDNDNNYLQQTKLAFICYVPFPRDTNGSCTNSLR